MQQAEIQYAVARVPGTAAKILNAKVPFPAQQTSINLVPVSVSWRTVKKLSYKHKATFNKLL